jgi:hypothetical protein
MQRIVFRGGHVVSHELILMEALHSGLEAISKCNLRRAYTMCTPDSYHHPVVELTALDIVALTLHLNLSDAKSKRIDRLLSFAISL